MGSGKERGIFFKRTFLFILLIFSICLVFASHFVETYNGTSGFSANESVETLFNVSVNNTDSGANANITEVNVTLPGSCTLTADSNETDSGADTFTNTSTVLSWSNSTGFVINGSSVQYFWFNATCVTPGVYNFTITTINSTDSYDSNLSLEINDTSLPVASFGGNPVETYNSSSNSITFDLKCADGIGVDYVQLWTNSTGTWHANQTNSSPVNNTYWNVSVSGIDEGDYIWAVYCNDTSGNEDWSGTNRTFTVDTTDPTVSMSCSSSSVGLGLSITCTCTDSDAGSGIASDSSTTPSTSTTGSKTATCTATDYAGNSATDLAAFTVVDLSGSSSSSSSGGGEAYFWFKGTYSISENQVEEGYEKEISERQRIRFEFSGELHHVGIRRVLENTAEIEVASDSQIETFSIGESKKFDLDGDNYYDLLVTLNSVQGGEADLTVKFIHEEKASSIQERGSDKETKDNGVSITGKAVNEDTEGGQSWFWWIGLAVLIVAFAVFYFLYKKNILFSKKRANKL